MYTRYRLCWTLAATQHSHYKYYQPIDSGDLLKDGFLPCLASPISQVFLLEHSVSVPPLHRVAHL